MQANFIRNYSSASGLQWMLCRLLLAWHERMLRFDDDWFVELQNLRVYRQQRINQLKARM